MSKLALGTVQFGLDYGVSNDCGEVQKSEVVRILNVCKDNDIHLLDTASSYGKSEQVLGDAGIKSFDIITKLPPRPLLVLDMNEWVERQVHNSLLKLKEKTIYGILIHNSKDLMDNLGPKLWDALQNLKKKGVIKKIGVSIYSVNELAAIEKRVYCPDIVQAPLNLFDQSIKTSGWLKKLSENRIEVHVRSVFLQGVLIQPKSCRDPYFHKWDNHFGKLEEWLNTTGQTAIEAALNFVCFDPYISKVIVGVQNSSQLEELAHIASCAKKIAVADELLITDLNLIHPQLWQLQNK